MYYVYELIDPRDNKVFYVGKGKHKRMYSHYNRIKNGYGSHNIFLERKIKKIINENLKPKCKKIFESENEEECFNKETERIKEIGRVNLCNLTNGGEGVSGCHKIRPNFTGHKHSEESKKRISESILKSKKYKEGMKNRDFNGEHNPMYGRSRTGERGLGNGKKSWETRRKNGNDKFTDMHLKNMSIATKNRPKLKCPNCGIVMDSLNIKKYHFDKCKHNIPD